MIFLKEEKEGILFKIKVQPRASKNEISGVMGDALKIRITAPPVDGEANDSVVNFLAKFFKVAKQDIVITSGHTGRNKSIFIKGITAQQFITMVNV